MGRYLIKRLGGLLFVVVALVVFTFFATNVLGDPIAMLTDPETATEEDIARLRAANGLDRPLAERFLDHTIGAFQGDFGKSIALNRPAGEVVLERVPATVGLALITVVFSVVVAVVLSVIAVRYRGKPIANIINIVSTALACLPSFWLAILLIIMFAVNWHVLPTSGYGWGKQLIMPVLSISAQPVGYFTQVLTTGMRNEYDQNYVRAARARGLNEISLLRDHVLRNTAILGVDHDVIFEDYVLTDANMTRMRDTLAESHPELLADSSKYPASCLRAEAINMQMLLDWMDENYGGPIGWLQAGGLQDSTIESLRAQMLD